MSPLSFRDMFIMGALVTIGQFMLVLLIALTTYSVSLAKAYVRYRRDPSNKVCGEIIHSFCEKKPMHEGKHVDEEHEVVWRR